MNYCHLGENPDPFAVLQQATASVQQAVNFAQKAAGASQQVSPTVVTSKALVPTGVFRPQMFDSFRQAGRAGALRSIARPALAPAVQQQAVVEDIDDKSDDKKKSNTAMYVALGLAAVAAVVLLQKKG